MRSIRFLSLFIVAAFFALNACGEIESDPRYVRIAITSNPQSLDPHIATDVNGGDVCAKVFNNLVRFRGLAVEADLAETWTLSPDGREYRFRIRQGVRFHNGRLLGAGDCEKSFIRLLDPATKSKRAWVLDAVDTFRALSPDIFLVRLKRPSAPFLSMLAMPAGAIVPIEEAARHGEAFGRHPCGTGPYRFISWEDDRSVVLERNSDYFEGAPEVGGIVFRVIPEPLTQVALLRRGSLDLCEVPDAQAPALKNDPDWTDRVVSTDGLIVAYVAINTERFPDARVRRAMNLAIDRGRVIESVRNGLATPAAGPVPPALSALPAPGYNHDPAEARRLLDDAGFDRSRRIVLLRNAPRGTLEPAEAVAGYLRDAGLNVTVEPMEFSSLRARANNGDYDLCLFNWFADYADAENFLAPLFHSKNIGSAGNRARLDDSNVDAAIEDVETLPPGRERDAAVLKAQSLAIQAAPWIFLWYPRTAMAVAPRLEGYAVPMIFNGEKGAKFRFRDATR
jgi:peptide/nickel transport system substrate-binding protein/oligopeptide transport system substrate-binding protein